MRLSCPGGWGRGCLGPCLTRSSECPLMAVGTRGAGGTGLAAGSGRAWDLALVPNLLQASPFPSLSLSFLLLSGERWLGEGGAPSTPAEMGKLRLQGHQAGAGSQHCPELLPRPFHPLLPGPLLQLTLHLSDCLSLSVHLSVFLHLPVSPFLYLSLLPAFPSVFPHYSSVCLSFSLSPLRQSDSFLSSLSASVCMFVSSSLSDSSSFCLLSPHLTVCLFPCLSPIPCLSLCLTLPVCLSLYPVCLFSPSLPVWVSSRVCPQPSLPVCLSSSAFPWVPLPLTLSLCLLLSQGAPDGEGDRPLEGRCQAPLS